MGKRGDLQYSPLIEIIVAVLIVLALTGLLIMVYKLVFSPNVTCDNVEDWNSLKKMFNSIDSRDFTAYEAYFYNKDCFLVSFTPAQPSSILPGNKVINTQPQLCLCKIENDKCNAYECFKFNYYNVITESVGNNKQFHTKSYEESLFLNFKRNNKELVIEKKGSLKSELLLAYTRTEEYLKFDPTSLITKMDITLTDSAIINFFPTVEVKKWPLTPEQIGIAGNFPVPFSIKLSSTKEGSTPKTAAEIPKEKIKSMTLYINITESYYNPLTAQQKSSLVLYYKKDNLWLSSKLECSPDVNLNYICSSTIDYPATDFAVSVPNIEKTTKSTERNVVQQYQYNNAYLNSLNEFTNPGKNLIDIIVLHHTGPSSGAKGVVDTLKSRGLSVHYIVDRDGKVYQIASENLVTWHAGCDVGSTCKKSGINSHSVGIEIVNAGSYSDKFTDAQYESINNLVKDIAERNNIPYDNKHIIGHYEITTAKYDPSPNFDWLRIGLINHPSYFAVNPGACPRKEDWGGPCPTGAAIS